MRPQRSQAEQRLGRDFAVAVQALLYIAGGGAIARVR